MTVIQHILAIYAVLRLVGVVPAEVAVARATWHLALVNNSVAWGWGHGEASDRRNDVYCLLMRAARQRIQGEAIGHDVYESYQSLVTLNHHWRLPARAPEVPGLPSVNIYGL
jgi:hypothetical protein